MFPTKSTKMGGPPKARVCFICGRQYMLHSFDIHVVQCRDLFEKRENTKPPKERRKCPSDPTQDVFYGGGGGGANISRKELDAINSASQQTWTGSLAQCKYCGRSFLPEKIGIHNKSCTADNPARRVDESVNRRIQSNENEVDLPTNKSISSSRRPDSLSAAAMTGGGAEYMDTVQCKECGRSFISTSFAKHAKICRKVFTSKRKPFDSAKARAKGTELASFQKSSAKQSASSAAARGSSTSRPAIGTTTQQRQMPMRGSGSNGGGGGGGDGGGGLPKWKAESQAFRAAMREARMVSRAEKQSKATGIPLHQLLPTTSSGRGGGDSYGGAPYVDPSFIQCPTCGRSFNQKAGERHIPQCSNIINKPSRLNRHSGQPSYSTNTPSSSGYSPPPLPAVSRSRAGASSSSGYGSMRERQGRDDHGYEIPSVRATVVRHDYGGDSLSGKLDGLNFDQSAQTSNGRSNNSAVRLSSGGWDSNTDIPDYGQSMSRSRNETVGANNRTGSRGLSGSSPNITPRQSAARSQIGADMYGSSQSNGFRGNGAGQLTSTGYGQSSNVSGNGRTASLSSGGGAPRYPSAGRVRR